MEPVKSTVKPPVLPDECYDPVTAELLDNPYITSCGHTFNASTFLSLPKVGDKKVKCPLCRHEIKLTCVYRNDALKKVIQVFNKYVNKEI